MEEQVNEILNLVTVYGLQLLAAVVIYVVGKWIAKAVTNFVSKLMTQRNVDDALVSFVKNLTYAALMTFVVLAALSKLGIQTASFIAVVGAAGLAVGMALQGSLANFAAGVLIILFKPFRVGDYIDAGGAQGTVQEISIFTTILHTPDNKKVIVPNGQIMSGTITNVSANDTRRVDLVMGVSYDDDLKKAREVIESVLSADSRVLSDPAYKVAVSELADSSVNFVVRPWVKKEDYWDAYFELTENLKVALENAGLSIPYPQQDLYLKEVPASATTVASA